MSNGIVTRQFYLHHFINTDLAGLMTSSKGDSKGKITLVPELEPQRRQLILNLSSFVGKFQANRDCCGNCKNWIGRCLKGKMNVIACSNACESFKRRQP